MMTQDRDYEEALRRALTAAAESIEPAGDGLQRIRHRLNSPRSPRSVLSRCTGWLELHRTRFLVRLEPVTEAGRTAVRRTGPLLALVSFLRRLLSPGPARRDRGAAGSPGRLGPAGPWLKPLFAVSAAVAIVVAGVVILNHETGTLISPSNSVTTPSSQSTGMLGRGTTANSKRWKLPLGVSPTQPATSPAMSPGVKSVPVVACTPTPSPAASTAAPTGGATPTPTPTATASATPTGTPATPQPTATGQPTPTPTSSPATSGAATSGAATTTAATTAMYLPDDDAGGPAIVECGTKPS